jgi:glycosyltransferase involved in cell wall biosynthesis
VALRDAGVRVEEAHAPVWERVRDKSGAGPRQLARIAVGLALAYGRLVPEVALRLLRCDALVIGYIGQVDMLLLGPVAKLTRKPVIFDPLVTLTDTIVEDRGLVSPRSPLAWALAAIDRAALRLADVVLADTDENARYMTDRFGIAADRIFVVPVGADEAVFYENERTDWSDATPDRPLDILFYGKFIPLHGIETIVRAAGIVSERGIPVRFELVGTGQTYREMRALADRLDVSNVTWTDWIPEDRLGDRLRRADVALGVFSGGAKAGRVVPNKVYQSLASGVATVTRESAAVDELGWCRKPLPNRHPEGTRPARRGAFTLLVSQAPLLAGRVPSGWRLGRGLEAHECEGMVLVPPDDPQALASAIERLCNGSERERIARGGKAAYEKHTGAMARAGIMRDVVERVMGDRWQRQPVRG